jgi:predicted TIM-barrel fold metal-dependent hydrolase
MSQQTSVDPHLLIDHHCHGVSPAELDFAAFQAFFSESYRPPPPGTTEFQKPLGIAIRRFCAPLLDLEASASGEAYVERRLSLGAAEVNRRFLRAAGIDRLIIDTGLRESEILSPAEMAEAACRPAHEVVRIETVIEEVAKSGVDAAAFPASFADRLADRASGAVGLKSIVAYRSTFSIDQTAPEKREVVEAAGNWFRSATAAGKWRISHPTLIRYGLWVAADICRSRRQPLQLHVGFGDPDVYMHACDPTHFTDFIAAMDGWNVAVTLLHNYPFHREAAWLSEVFRNVYYDIGVIQNYAALNATQILAEAFEVGKFTKQLYSSDAFGLSELYYLGAVNFRRALKRCIDRWLAEDLLTLADADEIIGLVFTENARRIYLLDGA